MRSADQFLARQADEIIFIVIGESQHLVRHDVADVDDQIPRLLHQHSIQHNRHRPVGSALGGFFDEIGRNRAHLHAASAPIVGVDSLLGYRAEHPPVFIGRVRHVLAERGDHVHFGLLGEDDCTKSPSSARPWNGPG